MVAFGGDGTINEVIGGLTGTEVPLGILPGGTANVLAMELGIPLDLRQASKVVTAGVSQRISVGRAGSRHFHLMAGIGLDAAVVSSMPPRLKDLLGTYSFWIQGFRQLSHYYLRPFRVDVDGRVLDATFAVIANARNYGGPLRLAPEATVSSDHIDVCLFRSQRKTRYFTYLATGYFGRHVHLRDVIYLKARRVAVRGDASISVQVDGELAGCLPMDFEVVPKSLSVLVPRGTKC